MQIESINVNSTFACRNVVRWYIGYLLLATQLLYICNNTIGLKFKILKAYHKASNRLQSGVIVIQHRLICPPTNDHNSKFTPKWLPRSKLRNFAGPLRQMSGPVIGQTEKYIIKSKYCLDLIEAPNLLFRPSQKPLDCHLKPSASPIEDFVRSPTSTHGTQSQSSPQHLLAKASIQVFCLY